MLRIHHGCVDWNLPYYITDKATFSHPSRMRGLKLCLLVSLIPLMVRIHHGCVDWNYVRLQCSRWVVLRIHHGCVDWNNTTRSHFKTKIIRIHHGCVDWNIIVPWIFNHRIFASITDAWIETPSKTTNPLSIIRIHHGCVDWNIKDSALFIKLQRSHPSRMRGLKQLRSSWIFSYACIRIHHGCVDWN